jgi:hypothetical protein
LIWFALEYFLSRCTRASAPSSTCLFRRRSRCLWKRGGPADPFQDTQSGFAPEGQVGYFSQFSGSSWLWGFKLLYQYSDLTTANRDILPQAGQFTTTGAAPVGTTFTGNVLIGSSQTRINHQIDFMPFLGHAFANGYVYGGVGPALFGIQSNIYSAIGFADVNGVHMDVTGTPANFSSSNWVVGGAAQVGVTYSIIPTRLRGNSRMTISGPSPARRTATPPRARQTSPLPIA